MEFVTSSESARYCPNCKNSKEQLLAQAETVDNLAVPIRVTAVEIVQQAAALIDHHDQSATGCMVLHMGLEVRGQIVDPLAEKRNLHFGRACILDVGPELLDQHCFRCAQVPLSVIP